MIGMRIRVVMVPVIMVMAVVVAVVMAVMMPVMMMVHIQPAGTGAEMVTQVAILDIASRRRDALPLNMLSLIHI